MTDSDDDYQSFSPLEEASSPFRTKKLKRLKKAASVPNDSHGQRLDPGPSTNVTGALNDADIDPLETLDRRQLEAPMLSVSAPEDLNVEGDSNDGFDDLFVYRQEDRRDLDVREGIGLGISDAETEEFGGNEDDRNKQLEEGSVDLKPKKSAKKRNSLEGLKENKEKKKKKRVKEVGDVGKTKAPAHSERRADKVRKAHFEQLHAETQRLLRETRDAAFKPFPLVQKPVSSVLEKIRQRKLEMLKKAGLSNGNDYLVDDNGSPKEVVMDLCTVQGQKKGQEYDKRLGGEIALQHLNAESNLDSTYADGSSVSEIGIHENNPSHSALDEESKCTFRAPINDTQELFYDSQTSGDEEWQPNDLSNSRVEEVLTPSLLTMNLKLDSAPPDDISFGEEDGTKENIDPHQHNLVSDGLSPKGDPVKAFVDDEAVEEDDSDNDLRFGENDEDDENGDTEELNDLIVTGYKEKMIDCERRDQLHQKWLEEQDAASTENVLQRLKCAWKQRELKTHEDEEEDGEKDQEFSEESMNEATYDTAFTNNTRINSKKAKQLIPQMFSDKDDVFLSDDEETEHRLARQLVLEKVEEEASFLSPAEDENSREVFGLIKKLNTVHDANKKGKTSSFFDMLITGGNSNSSSKSSFLGRAANNSLPSSHRQGSSTARSFIFGRDDSNSRSAMSSPEVSSDVPQSQKERRSASSKFSNSRATSSQNTKMSAQTVSGSSLFEILKGSVQSDRCTRTNMLGQTQTVFAAFKSGKKSMKIERT